MRTFQNLPVAWPHQVKVGAEDNRANPGIGKPETEKMNCFTNKTQK